MLLIFKVMRLFARNGVYRAMEFLSSFQKLKITSLLDIGLKLQGVNEFARRADKFCEIVIL